MRNQQSAVSSEAQQRGVSALQAPDFSAVPPQARANLTLVEKDERRGTATFRDYQGNLITAVLAPSDVTNQREQLDTYLGGFTPFGFGADILAPIVPVDREKGDRRDLSKENAFEVVDTRMGRQGAFNEVDLLSELGTYEAQEYGLASFLPWQTENDAQSNFNVRALVGTMLSWKLALHREVRVMDFLSTLTTWPTTNRLAITTNFQWDSGSTKNPRADLQAIFSAMTMQPAGIAMNPDVAYHFLADSEIRAYIRATQGDDGPKPEVAQGAMAGTMGVVTMRLVGLPPIYILPAKKLVSGTLTYILADDVIVFGDLMSNPNDGLRMATALTYRTRGRSGTGIQTSEWVPQGRGNNSGTMFNVGFGEDVLLASGLAGGLIKSVLTGT